MVKNSAYLQHRLTFSYATTNGTQNAVQYTSAITSVVAHADDNNNGIIRTDVEMKTDIGLHAIIRFVKYTNKSMPPNLSLTSVQTLQSLR